MATRNLIQAPGKREISTSPLPLVTPIQPRCRITGYTQAIGISPFSLYIIKPPTFLTYGFTHIIMENSIIVPQLWSLRLSLVSLSIDSSRGTYCTAVDAYSKNWVAEFLLFLIPLFHFSFMLLVLPVYSDRLSRALVLYFIFILVLVWSLNFTCFWGVCF